MDNLIRNSNRSMFNSWNGFSVDYWEVGKMKFLHKKKSKIHGFGIFTTKEIRKGAVFYKVPMDQVYDKPKPRFAHIGKNKYVKDTKILNWVNHSCNANTILDLTGKQPKLVAKRNIKAGEEITCNYNLTEKGGNKVKCTCKKEKCKKYFLRRE
ncbi:SET domain-containing protein-lysine N-methyltransferase [Candidatus Woesearchaeota archaeon]|nr:SET domain-containing protein-lysine N-methyltransferase [Candidatus Woesearchaeota archaeon]